MFQQVRKHLNASTFIALLALVFAVTGGAFAATSHSGGGSPAKATASVTPVVATTAKKKAKAPARGPAGPKGATGAAGATGATGPAGATGPGGAQGSAGTNGTDGTNGEPGKEGKEGAKGKEGKEGKQGVIHPGETLAPEASETGAWSFGSFEQASLGDGGTLRVPVASFTIPLAAPLEATGCGENPIAATCHVHYINKHGMEVIENGATSALEELSPLPQCPGTVSKPEAAPGNFCVYAHVEEQVQTNSGDISNPAGNPAGGEGAGTTGAYEVFSVNRGDSGEGWGTWAVTAPARS